MKTLEELADEYRYVNFNYRDVQNNFEPAESAVVYAIVAEEIRKAFIAGYAAANRWISVEEELPTYDKNIWLFCIFNYPKLENKMRLACWNPSRKKFECAYMSEIIEDYVTHWMPIPAMPTEIIK